MPRSIGREEVQHLQEQGAQLVEALPIAEYEEEHIAGAVNIPLGKIDREVRDRLDPTRPVIVYCYDDP
jgi:phage shock protein E